MLQPIKEIQTYKKMSVADVVALCQSPGVEVHMSRYSLRPMYLTKQSIKSTLLTFYRLKVTLLSIERIYILSVADVAVRCQSPGIEVSRFTCPGIHRRLYFGKA